MTKNYRDLVVWQKAITLSTAVYKATEDFPKREHYGLASQIRKSAVSIASNIAEGSARQSDREFSQFIIIARGSMAELHTQLVIAEAAGYINSPTLNELLTQMNEIGRMLHALKLSLVKPQPQLIDS